MKRMHIGVVVEDLEASLAFYRSLFGAEPSLVEEGYARWMLDDPRVNFAINTRGPGPGVDHLGIQVESDAELSEITGRLKAAGCALLEKQGSTCGYALQNKAWTTDPQGLAWETFRTVAVRRDYGENDLPDDDLAALRAAARDGASA